MNGFICGDDVPSRPARERVQLTPFVCPWCRGTGRWASGERCNACGSAGLTDDPSVGIDLSTDYPAGVAPPEVAPAPLPRPPAVMRTPCADCAFRPGSPERHPDGQQPDGDGPLPGMEQPFYCHHGMATKTNDPHDYAPAAWIGGRPLGYFVCAGWWQVAVEGQEPPVERYEPARPAPIAAPQPVIARRAVRCAEGAGGVELDGGCPWCSRDISQRPSGRLYRHHDEEGDVCWGSGRIPVPRIVTADLAGAVL